TSQLADQIARRSGGKSAQFDISLDPAGLGKVNVKVRIDTSGQLTAQIAFDNPAAAAEAKARAGDLQQALTQAGFDISQNGLSFQSGGQGGGLGSNPDGSAAGGAGQAWAADTIDETPPTTPAPVRSSAGAVDITI
ncbi:MAG TPA: flagellar hook-length control protein FliK, partial [Caulobacteraceae bacterium]